MRKRVIRARGKKTVAELVGREDRQTIEKREERKRVAPGAEKWKRVEEESSALGNLSQMRENGGKTRLFVKCLGSSLKWHRTRCHSRTSSTAVLLK